MSSKRTILIEATLVIGVLTAGISATNAAHAAPLTMAVQAADSARANVKIESEIMVERTESGANGEQSVKLYSPSDVKVVPGDKLIFINKYKNTAATPVTGFVVNNPIHPAVNFVGVDEDWAVVSVDGGKNFGKLDKLIVKAKPSEQAASEDAAEAPVDRAANPVDVTQIRWAFAKPIAPGASGELRFRGTVK